MARILADEHFPIGIVNVLRRLGHDVLAVRQVNVSKSGDATPDDAPTASLFGGHCLHGCQRRVDGKNSF